MADENAFLLVLSVVSLIPYVTLIPISIHGTMRLYKRKSEFFVKKRFTVVAIGLNVALLFTMFSSFLCHISVLYISNAILTSFSFSLFFMNYWIVLLFLNTKNWMIFYKEKWTYYTLDLEWQSIINHKVAKHENQNWFVSNHHKYGNFLYVIKLFIIAHLIGFLLLITSQVLLETSNGHPSIEIIAAMMFIITITPYILFYVIVVFKTPRFNDIFNIHWESQQHARLSVVMGFGIIGLFICYVTVKFEYEVQKHIWAMIAFPFFTIMLFLVNMVSTLFLIRKCAMFSLDSRIAQMACHITHSQSSHVRPLPRQISRTSTLNKFPNNRKLYSLDVILSNQESFHLFMVHLSREFSMECLLSFIEFNQFQQHIISDQSNKDQITEKTLKMLKLVIFPNSIPTSAIIEEENTTLKLTKNNAYSYKLKAHKLFDKYIKIGSEYEINIDYEQRAKWINLVGTTGGLWSFMHVTINLNELLLLFERSKNTMAQLLGHSLSRFKLQPEFDEVQKVFDKMMSGNAHSRSTTVTTMTKRESRTITRPLVPLMNMQRSMSAKEVTSVTHDPSPNPIPEQSPVPD